MRSDANVKNTSYCSKCKKTLTKDVCPICNSSSKNYIKQQIDIRSLISSACRNLKIHLPSLVKGVKGMTNETKTPEILEKGLLRAKHGLSVFKDGTIRFDVTNAPLTHFTPKETGISIDQLRLNGYLNDFEGNTLSYKEEGLVIDEKLEVTRVLGIPEDVSDGDYVFYSKVSYGNVSFFRALRF